MIIMIVLQIMLTIIGIICSYLFIRGLKLSNPYLSGQTIGWTQYGFYTSMCGIALIFFIIIKNIILAIVSGVLLIIFLCILIHRLMIFAKTPIEEKKNYVW